MLDPYLITRRTSSSSHTQQETARQRNEENVQNRMSREMELNRAKRKSNAYLAAEAVQQERDAIKTLKRLSMGGSLTLDPDLPYGVDNEFEDFQKRQTRRRSSSGSSNNSVEDYDDEAEKTLIEDPVMDDTLNDEDEDIKIDSERLMWVPANAHPSIAPDQFRRHIQSTLDDMTKKQHSKDKSSDSIPSLKELTDELDKLSEIAGLAATDAVTLARSLSSASSSSSLLYGDDTSLNSPSSRDAGPSSEVTRLSEDEVDQDAPLLSVGNSLKRNKWTTYTRRNRTDKDKQRRRHSPLSDEHFKAFQQSNNFGEYSKQLPPQPEKSLPSHSNQRSVSQGEPPRDITNREHNQLSRSQSDIVSAAKRTNHSRNRHAGSLINIETTPEGPTPQQNKTIPPPVSKDAQNPYARRRVSPLSVDVRAAERDHQQSRPQALHQNQAQAQTSTPTAPRTPPLQQQQQQQYMRPETQVTKEVPEPPTPIQPSIKEKEKDKENKSKSKEFLNMFKMKRSTSPKSKDKTKTTTPTRSTFFNDENVPSGSDDKNYPNQHYQRQQSPPGQYPQHHHQQHQQKQPLPQQPQQKSPQRPSLRPNSFKLMKQREEPKQREQRSLQESVNVVPKNNSSRSPSGSSFSQIQKSPEPSSQPTTPTGQQFSTTPSTPITPEEQHRAQKQLLERKLSKENIQKSSKPNAPVQFTDSAFGFPLPPLSHSTIIMLDYRFPVHVERALYRLSHLKLANPRRPLRQQVLLSNFMYAYLNLVNHTLYLQQLDEEKNGEEVESTENAQEV